LKAEQCKFYSDTTVMGGRLIEAYDRERERLSRHLGSRAFQSTVEFNRRSYEYQGKDIGTMLGENYWQRGIGPEELGVDGMDTGQLLAYVMQGSN